VHDANCNYRRRANIGLYSVLLLCAKWQLRIFAFKAVPSTYTLAKRNMALYQATPASFRSIVLSVEPRAPRKG
jgi:hypothetical protein